MTGEQYIYKRKYNYSVNKSFGNKNCSFGFYKSLDDAIFARDLFVEHDWDMDEIENLGNVLECNGKFLVVLVYNGQLKFLERFDSREEAVENSQRIIQNFIDNPYNSKYGTYIYGIDGTFYIRKSVDKKEVWFGLYSNLDDATFARNLLRQNDWDLKKVEGLAPVCFSEVHGKYAVFSVIDNKVVVADKYDSESEALKNAQESLGNIKKRRYKSGEKHVVFNGNLYAVHRGVDHKIIYYGSFREFEDAVAVRDLLVANDWDLKAIYENRIYELNGHFYKFHIFEDLVKIIGKFTSYDDAVKNENNLSTLTYEDIYDPENQYSKVNRYITKKYGKFWIKKKIGDRPVVLGPYETRADAIDARDVYEANDWDIGADEDSLYSDDGYYEDPFEDVVSKLTMWQKIIYDTIVRLDKTYFSFDELLSHSYLKRYKSGNYEKKVSKHLGELVDLGLVTQLEENIFRKEF